MDLAAAVKEYLKLVGGFDRPLPLTAFGLSRTDTERIFSAWDEDYQISRYLDFSRAAEDSAAPTSMPGHAFVINGQISTHVSFRSGIHQLLKS